ncbi:hypothetical protein [Ferruginibacter albus]|uniref:hypothetical protein n=1 Tax=Ferruginibacter albus TaxID=2875540 RepID=UPI001CC46579|nr:hypothetical protein [Ferruginibacter albus]UAY50621.1 hypothetical protein K9M53_08435 [Ferruginibacter albus]
MNNLKFLRAPDAGNASGAPSNTPAPAHKKSGLPKKDSDFLHVAVAVAKAWTDNPVITLVYTNAADFSALVASYETQLKGRAATGGGRPILTQTLSQLDASIDAAVSEVKVYLQKKFKKQNAPAHYLQFGIEKRGEVYELPRDRNKRLVALQQMKDAITAEGFAGEEYGGNFWNDIYTVYNASVISAGNTDGKISEQVGAKNTNKEQIKKVMKSLRRVLEGNYPGTYPTLYRSWGWQKEDY